ncbi:MAG: 2-phospho-L-lactate transferase [Polyangiales bacterium]
MSSSMRFTVLAGGVGGAKLVDGLDRALPREQLRIIANTGDDFEHWGLSISPDIDTLMYTLAGKANPTTGWGLKSETFNVMKFLVSQGADDWFMLGDKDLRTHVLRTRRLREGHSLTSITQQLCELHGVQRPILPMSDGAKRTFIYSGDNRYDFQTWLVRLRTEPVASGVEFVGNPSATSQVVDALEWADVVFIAPSNPYVSIDPILTTDPIHSILSRKKVIAVSPIVGNAAIKGPLATMLSTIDNRHADPTAIAEHYVDLLSGFVIDTADQVQFDKNVLKTNIVMKSENDRLRLAHEIIKFASDIP